MLSVIIPVYNEEENVIGLYNEIMDTLGKQEEEFEIIFVDDGSTDKTVAHLTSLLERAKYLQIIELRRNFGQSAALCAGFHQAKGEIILSLDGDGQNDPKDIPKLLQAMSDNIDVVCGWRYNRKDSWIFKSLPSLISNFLNRRLNKVNIHDSGCTLRAYRKEAVSELFLTKGEHRYLPAILHQEGFNITEVKVNHRPRIRGKTKYGIKRLFAGLTDLITLRFLFNFGQKPIKFFSRLGVIFLLTSLGLGIDLLVEKFVFGEDIGTRPLLLLTILLAVSGFQFVLTGFLAELIVRQNKASSKIYNIKKIHSKNS